MESRLLLVKKDGSMDSRDSIHGDVTPETLASSTRIWIDIEQHTEDLAKVGKLFGLHELAIEDALAIEQFPKLESYGSHTFLVLRSLRNVGHSNNDGEQDNNQIDTHGVAIFYSPQFLITYRSQEVPWLDAIFRTLKQHPESFVEGGTDDLIHRVLDVLVDRFQRGIELFEKEIDLLEGAAISVDEEFEISKQLDLKRRLVALRQITREHRIVISRFAADPGSNIKSSLRRYFDDVIDHTATTMNMIDRQIDELAGVRDAHFATANARLGDAMRIIAVLSFVLAPINIVVGIFGMNFEIMPLLHSTHGFWLTISLLLMLTGGMLTYFRHRKWL